MDTYFYQDTRQRIMVEFEKGQKYFGTCFASRKVAQT